MKNLKVGDIDTERGEIFHFYYYPKGNVIDEN